ncbi:MAG: NAD(P)H-hydrate dehydratase [Clostridia bacterium]|nr:NAD(P)H-hydrate dehydratase [Clostridia bacterium]
MWKTITPAEMKRVETEAMERGFCTGEALMNRAAEAVATAIRKQRGAGRVIALCGVGNNGGDAIAAMRILAKDAGFAGEVWLMNGRLSPDAQRELERLRREGQQVLVRQLMRETAYAQAGVLMDADGKPLLLDGSVGCLMDGLFGTGLSRPVEGMAAALCRLACAAYDAGVPVVAVDIPSGLCGRTGQVLGEAVRATETITFHRPKPGLFLGQGLELSGRVTVAEIGLMPQWDDAEGLAVCQPEDIPALLPRRSRISHKGDHGRVALLCGSTGMAGAAAIAATAALRAGAGLVTVACPERILDVVQTLCPCATCLPLSHDADTAWAQLQPLLESVDALGVGCGLGQGTWAKVLLDKVLVWLSSHSLRAVMDADGLNLLAQAEPSALDLSRCILTPHPGEAARLLGCSVPEITADALDSANRLRQRYGAAVVLKGAASVLVSSQGAALNVLGTSAMGKGGSGDALTGVLCALLAERARLPEPFDLLALMQAACGMHGLAGCAAETMYGNRGVLATDLCACLGLVERTLG